MSDIVGRLGLRGARSDRANGRVSEEQQCDITLMDSYCIHWVGARVGGSVASVECEYDIFQYPRLASRATAAGLVQPWAGQNV